MRRLWSILIVGILLGGGLLTLRGFGLLGNAGLAEVKHVPAGHQEIAWIAPATTGDAWERLVAAVRRLEKDWAAKGTPLKVVHDNAFLSVAAGVPELGLCMGDGSKLWIRWYKVSSDTDARAWIHKLAQRGTAPLAVIGGDTSDRALALARALQEERGNWPGAPPLFLITTATADRYVPDDQQNVDLTQPNLPKLMEVYPGLSFRFSFTNSRMAETVLDFVKEHPDIWPRINRNVPVLAGAVAAGDSWSALGRLAGVGALQPIYLYTLAWNDDRYSLDLADRFGHVFQASFYPGVSDPTTSRVSNSYVDYSVGDAFQANAREVLAVGLFLANPSLGDQRQLLALPTGTQRARRFLHALCRRAPKETKNLVVLSGDSISFNNIFRDREILWDIQNVPVPLIFFCHRNPVDPAAGFRPRYHEGAWGSTTGTNDLLLSRDLVEALLLAAWQDGKLIGDASALRDRLRQVRWHDGVVTGPDSTEGLPLFDAEGNRRPRTGEFVVWLRPSVENARVLPRAEITVWSPEAGPAAANGWRRFGNPLTVHFDRSLVEEQFLNDGD